MSDLIDRQAAIDAMKDMYHAAEKWGKEASDDVTKARAESCMASLVEMKLRIEKLPSAQPDIIVCADCKHHSHDAGYGRDWCNRISGVFPVKPDDYCSRAERRTDGSD